MKKRRPLAFEIENELARDPESYFEKAIASDEADRWGVFQANQRSASAKGHRETRKQRKRRQTAKSEYNRVRQDVFRGSNPKTRRKHPNLQGFEILILRLDGLQWVTRREMIELMPEYAEGSVRAWHGQRLQKADLMDRRLNPDFDQGKALGNQVGAKYQYRLNERGRNRAAEIRKASDV